MRESRQNKNAIFTWSANFGFPAAAFPVWAFQFGHTLLCSWFGSLDIAPPIFADPLRLWAFSGLLRVYLDFSNFSFLNFNKC